MNVYVGIFSNGDARELADFRGEEAETVRALSRGAAMHKLLYEDKWEFVNGSWKLMHYIIPRKYKLKELVYLYTAVVS